MVGEPVAKKPQCQVRMTKIPEENSIVEMAIPLEDKSMQVAEPANFQIVQSYLGLGSLYSDINMLEFIMDNIKERVIKDKEYKIALKVEAKQLREHISHILQFTLEPIVFIL